MVGFVLLLFLFLCVLGIRHVSFSCSAVQTYIQNICPGAGFRICDAFVFVFFVCIRQLANICLGAS
jgi:site-specific recombinase